MPYTDGIEVEDCPDCKGHGHFLCEHCGSMELKCGRCNGSGEVPVEEPETKEE